MDVSRIVARANVPQAQATAIHIGAPAIIRPADASGDLAGKVTVVSPATDAASTTVQVWVEAPNPGERLKPGAGIRVLIDAAAFKDALVVPASAIVSGEEGGNAVVVVPQYGAPNDRGAVTVIQALFPERKAVGLRADHILTGGGSFHCISQQIPR